MRCAACDAELPSEARFCPSCGTPAASKPAGVPQEERKVVTVVFCDLVGSTALSGVLDPETLRTVVLRYFDRMRECLEEFGGTVEKFIGDAVMAVFGVPVTHEDDAARALAAGLAMLEAVQRLNDTELGPSLGIRIGVRIGINTGPVVTASDVSSRQALVSGETVNVAARLEQNAGEGEVLIGPESLRAAGARALTEPVGPLLLKGKEDAVSAYRLLAVVEEEPEVTRRFDVPFVGRDRQLDALREALAAAAERDGRGPNLVTVFGEAGMGKTRLIHEWRKQSGGAFAYGSGRCRPYGERGSLAPLAEAVRQLLDEFPEIRLLPDARGGDGPDGPGGPAAGAGGHGDGDTRGAGAAAEDAAEGDEVGAALAVLSAGLLEDGTPNPSTDDTCAALTGLLAVLARRRPVVLVLDDLHWASDPLLAMVTALRAELASAGVLFVCAARPDLADRHAGWGGPGARALTLPGLTTPQAEAVAEALTEVGAHWDGAASPDRSGPRAARPRRRTGVPPQVLESAGGNPFYLEQLIAALTQPDSGYRPDGGGDLPTTLQALLGARIGALGRAERAALDIAAVAGREFTADEVADLVAGDPEGAPGGALHDGTRPEAGGPAPRPPLNGPVGAALARLGRHRLLSPADRPRPGTYPLRFSSGLVHEVTYQSMAKRTRAERHEHAALALSERLAAATRPANAAAPGGGSGAAGGPAGAGDGPAGRNAVSGGGSGSPAGAVNASASGGSPSAATGQASRLSEVLAEPGAVVGGAPGSPVAAAGGALSGGPSTAAAMAAYAVAGPAAVAGAAPLAGTPGRADPAPGAARVAPPSGSAGRGASAEGLAAVAAHLERAYRYRAELGVLGPHTEELRLRAVRLLIDAGSRALARSDLAWAAGLLERAVELAAEGEPEWAAAARRLGDVLLATGRTDEGRALLLQVLDAADAGPRDAVRPVEAAHARLALAAVSAAPDGSSAGTVAQWALPVFEGAGDDLGQARACIRIAQDRQSHGSHVAADDLLSRALAHARRAGAEPERALALGAIGISLWRGPEPVSSAVARSRALLAEHGEQRPTVRLTLNCPLAVLLALQERWEEADACLARSRRLAGELGYAEGRVVLPLFAATVAALADDRDRALHLLDEADGAAAGLQAGGLRGVVARESARLLLDAGRVEDAVARLTEVPGGATAGAGEAASDTADLDGLLARIAAARGNAEEAETLAARAVHTASGTDSPVLIAVAWLDRADVLRRSGRAEDARQAAAQAARQFAAKGHLPGARQAARWQQEPA
ncbi:putative adenylate/guanylate cyclase [Actinacidiphila reveromycinica]|uniref:Putative adenylate/guanylate cyclase n=1 Tax=Actinacidiphila reveromycinica TaxID=659352 RepID=A0A7U3UNH9_9ACTN|nr:adenylate/guanylate cyclase domain-containing protein [Streptomyces sp. SN-593]BBA95841.1 putative adenylate/guanylate cyclase [Streptomyces sp. SN-593]